MPPPEITVDATDLAYLSRLVGTFSWRLGRDFQGVGAVCFHPTRLAGVPALPLLVSVFAFMGKRLSQTESGSQTVCLDVAFLVGPAT